MHERKQTGSSAKLLCGGMRPGGAPRAAGRHVRAEPSRAEPSQEPTVCQYGRVCMCQPRPDLWPKREQAGWDRVQVHRRQRRLGEQHSRVQGRDRQPGGRKGREGKKERKLRWAAGSVCGRSSLRRLLTRRGKGKGPQCRAVGRGANVWRKPIASICLPLQCPGGTGEGGTWQTNDNKPSDLMK